MTSGDPSRLQRPRTGTTDCAWPLRFDPCRVADSGTCRSGSAKSPGGASPCRNLDPFATFALFSLPLPC
jgi:hypothetical protein